MRGDTYDVYAIIVEADDLHTCGMMAITTGNHQTQYFMPLIYLSGNTRSSRFLLFVTTGVTDCGIMPTQTGRHCSTTNWHAGCQAKAGGPVAPKTTHPHCTIHRCVHGPCNQVVIGCLMILQSWVETLLE